MPALEFALTALVQHLDDELLLAEALFFPEVSILGTTADRLHDALCDNAERLVASFDAVELFRRHQTGPVSVASLTLTLAPPPRSAAWRQAVELTLPVVRWTHGEDYHLAYLPTLGIEVVAATEDALNDLLPKHARSALLRSKRLALHRLARLERCRTLESIELRFEANVLSPKRRVQADEAAAEDHPFKTLKEVGTDLTGLALGRAFEVEPLVARLAEVLTARTPRSVLLVGPSGVGKTAVLHELVRRRHDFQLGRTPFWATSGARLVAGQCGFGMWQQRVQQVWREASKSRAILHLGNLVELLDVGKSEHRSQGIASFLRPYLQRGDLLVVAECLPEQKPFIERQDPHLLQAFVELKVDEPTPEQARRILTSVATTQRAGSVLDPSALEALDRLHRRYATYSAYPGRPLRFLRNLLADAPREGMVSAADVTAAFARETGLPLFLLEDSVPLRLAEARDWFAARVIGQAETVALVVDLLATIKARLTRPRKPIASLLFIGPTGVGKTEMAKALAEYLFGSPQRLTRYDMSEYADPLAVQRLIGGRSEEGLLTAKVREQPFSVILLDEFEKADPQLFDLLLQVLGEGRLTDAAGRLADFCNSVVIMTSNLGAASYQQGKPGFGASSVVENEEQRRALAREHFVTEVQRFLRPELYNRLDRIIPFSPLDSATILHIARRQLELIRQRDGIRYRGVTLEVAAQVTHWLAQRGFDARYGARPLKRAIERDLLAPLAARMNQYTADTPLRVEAAIKEERLDLHVRARVDDSGRQAALASAAAQVALGCVELRRDLQAVQRCATMREILNEIFRVERLEKRLREGKKLHQAEEFASLGKLSLYRRLRDALEEQSRAAGEREDAVLLALHAQAPCDDQEAAAALLEGQRRFEKLLIDLYAQQFDNVDVITVAIFSEQPEQLWNLTAAYAGIAERLGGRYRLWQFVPEKEERGQEPSPLRRRIVEPKRAFDGVETLRVQGWNRRQFEWFDEEVVKVRSGVVGLALEVNAPQAFAWFQSEEGLHQIVEAKAGGRCLVLTSELPMTGAREHTFFVPPQGIERRGAVGGQPKRRIYHPERGLVEDVQLGEKLNWNGRTWGALLYDLMQQQLQRSARSLLG